MLNISDTAKKLIIGTVCIAAILSIIGSFFITDTISFFIGALAATAISVLKIILMERSIVRSVDMDAKGAVVYARAQYAMRYFMTIGVMVAVASFSTAALYGAIAAMLAMPFASHAMRYMMRNENAEG